MSELYEAEHPPTPELDTPPSWEAADTGEPTEPKTTEVSTETDDVTPSEQLLETTETTESAGPDEPGEQTEPLMLSEPTEPAESADVKEPAEAGEAVPDSGEWEAPTESGELWEEAQPAEPLEPLEPGEWGAEDDAKGLQPEVPKGTEEPEVSEEHALSGEAEVSEDAEEPETPEQAGGAGEYAGEHGGEENLESEAEPGESALPEETAQHESDGGADGLALLEQNPESAEYQDPEQSSEDAAADESAEPGDAGDKIQETVGRPLIDNMYFEKDHEVKGLTYGDPINENPSGRMPLFDGPPTREQTAQGRLGDCGVIASIGAVAGHRPETIENAVRENPDGTYTVSLFDAESGADGVYRATGRRIELLVEPDLPIVESNPNVPAFAALPGSAWGAVLEKSMAGVDQAWESKRTEGWEATWQANPKAEASDGPTPVGYERLNQGSSQWDQAEMLTQLTGKDSAVYPFPTGEGAGPALESHLRRQLADNKPILAGTRPLDAEAGEKALPHNLVAGHAYEVVGADGGMVRLRNPWNMAHPEPMKTEEFIENFSYKEWGFYATLR
ncbi:hypothetical protein IHE56_15575 [Streptomyces sp. ID01-12c]|uniref:hypothetical protein n=1 Tax=Streptomyces caniscabiei TaxID=2746961 RepID=UPI001784E57F|nr:hypothetical protein [Streptomyces caniscabiei]MBD9703477.1 hypothetical protein [Streptomyces caniscabiei]MDX3726732.1 hypothetical protein [Streptomyces caniscabiei]